MRSWSRRHASVVACCVGVLAPLLVGLLAGLFARPVARRMLTLAGVAAAGWLLGAPGPAHAEAVAGAVSRARLPTAAAHAGRHVDAFAERRIAASACHVSSPRGAAPAVPLLRAAAGRSRPLVIDASSPAARRAAAGAERPGARKVMAGPSRTPRHSRPGHRAGAGGRSAAHAGPGAATGASEKAAITCRARAVGRAPAVPRPPRPLPRRAKALPPSSGGSLGHAGVLRAAVAGAARRPSQVSAASARALPPAARAATDEPSFSPD